MTAPVRLPHENPIVTAAVSRRLGVEDAVAADYLKQVVAFLDSGWRDHRDVTVQRRVPPSHEVDEAWHELITHTRVYLSLCRMRYGAYAHHDVDASTGAGVDCSVTFEEL